MFVILDSTGDLSGTFASVTTSGFDSGFQYSVIYDTNADLVKLLIIDAGGTSSAVPEPTGWALMIAGFSMIGMLARRRRRPR